jgi:hypothetical protein
MAIVVGAEISKFHHTFPHAARRCDRIGSYIPSVFLGIKRIRFFPGMERRLHHGLEVNSMKSGDLMKISSEDVRVGHSTKIHGFVFYQ